MTVAKNIGLLELLPRPRKYRASLRMWANPVKHVLEIVELRDPGFLLNNLVVKESTYSKTTGQCYPKLIIIK